MKFKNLPSKIIPSISVVLPIYNEVRSLSYVVEAWNKYFNSISLEHEFVFCEDGSTDGTKELIDQLLDKYPCIDLRSEIRRGYGGGVLSGIKYATKSHILCIDSDGQCMPDSFSEFLRNFSKTDVLIGIRSPRKDPNLRKVYSFLFKCYFKILFNSFIVDPSCPYILAKKDTYIHLVPYLAFMKEGFWWGFIGACHKKNLSISQYSIRHYLRRDGSTVVYKLRRMPSIIIRNAIGLLKLRFAK